LIYKYYLECKKGCEIDYIIETDLKEYIIKNKPICPKCGRRIYENESKTIIIGPEKVKIKRHKEEDELARRHAHKKETDGRRKKVNNHS